MVFKENIAWGAESLPWNDDSPHTVLLGAPRTGKTILLRMLMQSMMFHGRGQLATRVVVHDPKREFYPLLIGMGLAPSMIRVMHPLDMRCSPWNIASDFTQPEHFAALAEALVPGDVTGPNAVFTLGARELVKAVVTIFTERCGSGWLLNDVYNVCSEEHLLAHVLSQNPHVVAPKFVSYFSNARQRTAFTVTIQAAMGQFATVAAANARLLEQGKRHPRLSGEPISLSRWFQTERDGVILLTSDPTSSRAMLPFNHAAFSVLADRALSLHEQPDQHTQFYIDEARTQFPLPGLERLITQGASKGLRVTTVVHTLEGLRETYRGGADEILGASTNVGMTATNSATTKKWFLDVVASSQGYRASEARWEIDRMFSHLGAPDEKRRIIRGLFKIPNRPVWPGKTNKAYQARHLSDPDKRHPGFLQDDDPLLTSAKPMEPADWARLRIPVPQEKEGVLLPQPAPQPQLAPSQPAPIYLQAPEPPPRELTEEELVEELRKRRRFGLR